MKKLTVAACAVALAAVWTVGPVMAQTVQEKAERTGDKIEDKSESKMDKVKDKAVETKDKIKDKAVEIKDKTKEKAVELKNKLTSKKDKAKDKVVAKGDRMDVRTSQQALRDHGYNPGPIDGIHGPRTTAAVRKYQQAEGLTVNGRFDDATMAKLNVSNGTPSASPATDTTRSSDVTAPAPADAATPADGSPANEGTMPSPTSPAGKRQTD